MTSHPIKLLSTPRWVCVWLYSNCIQKEESSSVRMLFQVFQRASLKCQHFTEATPTFLASLNALLGLENTLTITYLTSWYYRSTSLYKIKSLGVVQMLTKGSDEHKEPLHRSLRLHNHITWPSIYQFIFPAAKSDWPGKALRPKHHPITISITMHAAADMVSTPRKSPLTRWR